MEGSQDIFMGSTSLYRSTSIWGTNSRGGFPRSSRIREGDDEVETLKRAALEKLPTYNLLRKGVLTTSRGEAVEV